jgi:U3 small nucleolar RNA-associated protein 12
MNGDLAFSYKLICLYKIFSNFTAYNKVVRNIILYIVSILLSLYKAGELQLFDIPSGTLLEAISAHQGAIWSMCLAPDRRGLVTGSADHEVRFWEFELVQDDDYSLTSKRLSLAHVKTLEMTDDVLCVKYSPDHRLLAVALLDNTVKVFFADTLKYFLSLYGHKLPVLTMDISSDSTLLITGSSDKNIKVWGLDFGDCHKSLFAHNDSIMAVQVAFLDDCLAIPCHWYAL